VSKIEVAQSLKMPCLKSMIDIIFVFFQIS